jgi:hypothetical protein
VPLSWHIIVPTLTTRHAPVAGTRSRLATGRSPGLAIAKQCISWRNRVPNEQPPVGFSEMISAPSGNHWAAAKSII